MCCCASGLGDSGLASSDYDRVPIELNGKITSEEWEEVVKDLANINGGQKTTIMSLLLTPFYLIGVVLLFPIYFMCSNQKEKVLARDANLRKWQNDFNTKFKSQGIFLKTRSHVMYTHDSDGGSQKEMKFWIEIALNPDASTKLEAEPHLTGNVADHSCGGTWVNDNELCWHSHLGSPCIDCIGSFADSGESRHIS